MLFSAFSALSAVQDLFLGAERMFPMGPERVS
jgi:hypothetical protein